MFVFIPRVRPFIQSSKLASEEEVTMRQLRAKVAGAYYHATSRCAFQTFAFEAASKDMFVKIMRRAEAFSGVEIANYCVMDNHFHLLVKVPERQEMDDAELDRRIEILYGNAKAEAIFKKWKSLADCGGAAAVQRERDAYRARMYDISHFMKTLKQRFSLWYTTHHGNLEGSIWQGRFHSTLVENSTGALSAVSAYIDMNPVRANIVEKAKDYAWSGFGAAAKGDSAAKAGILGIMAERLGETSIAKTGWQAEAWKCYRELVGWKEERSSNQQSVGKAARSLSGKMSNREERLSRGLAFGSSRYVNRAIATFRDIGTTRTCAIIFGTSGGKLLYCTGRQKRECDGQAANL